MYTTFCTPIPPPSLICLYVLGAEVAEQASPSRGCGCHR